MLLTVLDFIALAIFLVCWFGYTWFAKKRAKTTNCIAYSLHQHRILWMNELMTRDIKVADAALLANLERNIAFFASSTLLVIAGVLTLFARVEQLQEVITSFHLAQHTDHIAIQLKLSLLVVIFVMAFFLFTWSMRQYGFLNVMIGASPKAKAPLTPELQNFALQMAKVQDQAAHSYNYGLRSYYFSLAALSWFIHPLFFIASSLFVVYTLYRREFASKALMAITAGQESLKQFQAKQ